MSAVHGRARSDEAKDRRRQDILSAAKRVFARNGYHATTMDDIANAARISYGSVYWYFGSKEALFHSLMDFEEQALRRHIDAAIKHAGRGPGGIVALRAAVGATFDFFEDDRNAVKLLFRDPIVLGARFDQHLAGIFEGFIGDIEHTIEAAQTAGQIVEAPPRMVAFSVAALISQLALRRLTTDDGLPAAAVADFVVTLLLDGLRRGGAGSRRTARRSEVIA